MKFYKDQCLYTVKVVICFTGTCKRLRIHINIYIQLFGVKFSVNRMGDSQFDKIKYTHVYPTKCNGEVLNV
jgi:hypothetical protein